MVANDLRVVTLILLRNVRIKCTYLCERNKRNRAGSHSFVLFNDSNRSRHLSRVHEINSLLGYELQWKGGSTI